MISAEFRAFCLSICLVVLLSPAPLFAFPFAIEQSTGDPQNSQPDNDSLRNRALEEAQAGKTAEAIRDYRSALDATPDWKEGWWNLGMLEYSQKHFPEAQTAFERESSLAPDVAMVWALLGLSEFETGAFHNAEQHLQHAEEMGIQDQEIARVSSYHLSLLCIQSGQFQRAAQLLRSSFDSQTIPAQIQVALGLATLHIPLLPQNLNPSREALVSEVGSISSGKELEHFADLLAKYPDAPNLHLAYGEALEASENYEKALAQFRAETALSPENPLPWQNAARALMAHGKSSEAVMAARNAVRLSPKDPASHLLLADALKAEGESKKADAERDFAASLAPIPSPTDPLVPRYYGNSAGDGDPRKAPDQAVWNEARRAFAARDYSTSAANLKTWLASDPANGTAWALLGLSEFALHDYDNALIHLDRSARLGMNADADSLNEARYVYGVLLVRAGRFEEGDSILATAWQPSSAARVEFALGLSLLRRTQLPESVGASDRDLVHDAGRISALLQQSRYEEAFPLFKALLQQHPATPFLHYAYGTALLAVSDFDSAAAQMKAERDISPKSELPCLRLASISIRQHTPEPAIKWAQCALQLNPSSVDAHYLLGRASLDTGDTSAAIHELEIASKLSPASPEIHFNLAKAYARANMPAKAQLERETFTRLSQAQTPEKAVSKKPEDTAGKP